MKTVPNTIIVNSENVKSEHLSAAIITSVFKEESSVCLEKFHRSCLNWTAKTAIAWMT